MQIIDCLLSKNTTKRKPQEEIVLTNWHLPYDDGAGKKKNHMTKKNMKLWRLPKSMQFLNYLQPSNCTKSTSK